VEFPITSQAAIAAVVSNSSQPLWQQACMLDSTVAIADRVNSLAFSPDGVQLAIGSGMPSRNGRLAIIDWSDRALDVANPANKPPSAATLNDVHSDTILGLAYSPDGQWLATGGADKVTKLIDTQSKAVAKIFEGHTHHVLALSWHEDGHRLATASADETVKIWDIEQGESVKTITGFGTEVTAIAFAGSTANVVTSTLHNLVYLHDSNSGKQSKQFGPASDSLYSVVVSPNGRYAIAAGQAGIVRIWCIEDGRLVGEWK
jgi:WD40 repeat protein